MRRAVLDQRAREILRNVIAHYIMSGEPVGSRTLAKMSREGLSPATIRNVMADLEEMGYLVQPHTSAGRIPTDKGYRYYVDALLPASHLGLGERRIIDESLARVRGGLSEAMDAIPKLLSQMTSQVGYFLSPPRHEAILKHIKFLRLHPRRVLVVFVDSSGVVSNRILDVEEDRSQEELDRAGAYLVEEFSGMTLRAIRQRLVGLMAEEKATFDRMLHDAASLGTRYVDSESEERRLVMEGTSNILKHPELADVDTMRRLFETFEEKHHLVELLDRYLDRGGVQVVIGSETVDPAMGQLSLIASPYRLSDGAGGWFGVLGPTRMEYDRALSLVEYISRLFSTSLIRQND